MGKAATAVQDPYGPSVPEDGIHFTNMSPNPGAPTDGMSSMLRMKVPADNSWIEMGATSPPGIKAHANTHIGLTADTPTTTIELGTPTGGLRIDTAGHKEEHVKEYVKEDYDGTKEETVGGDLTEIYKGKKTEMVSAKVTEEYWSAKEENITGPLNVTVTNATTNQFKGGLTETVTGAWTVAKVTSGISFDTDGDFKVRATGHIETHGEGDHKWFQLGAATKVVIGADSALNVLVKNDIRLALHTDVRIGGHIQLTAGYHSQMMLGARSETLAGVLFTTGPLTKKDTVVDFRAARGAAIKQAAAELLKARGAIYNNIVTLFK
jgi:hypothetical protein